MSTAAGTAAAAAAGAGGRGAGTIRRVLMSLTDRHQGFCRLLCHANGYSGLSSDLHETLLILNNFICHLFNIGDNVDAQNVYLGITTFKLK